MHMKTVSRVSIVSAATATALFVSTPQAWAQG
jgi:hypothetical protein